MGKNVQRLVCMSFFLSCSVNSKQEFNIMEVYGVPSKFFTSFYTCNAPDKDYIYEIKQK